MYIEENSLGFSLFPENVREKMCLWELFSTVRSRGISFGAVGFIKYPRLLERLDEAAAKDEEELKEIRKVNQYRADTLRDNAEMQPYVWFPHANETVIKHLLENAGLSIAQVPFYPLTSPPR